MRLAAMGDQAAERGQASRGDVSTRGDAVIREAVPRRQRQHRDFRCGEGQHLLDVGEFLAVGEHIGDGAALTRELRDQEGIHTVRHARKRERGLGLRDRPGVEEGDHSAFPVGSMVTGEKSGRQAAMRSKSGV